MNEREVAEWPRPTGPVTSFPSTARPVRPWLEDPAPDEQDETEEQP